MNTYKKIGKHKFLFA